MQFRTNRFHIFLLGLLIAASACAEKQPEQLFIHDPVIGKDGDMYYLYSTGPGITFYSSKDLIHWVHEGRVFPGNPGWALDVAGTFNGHIWAPDILQHNGKFYLYYSVSAFGKNTSAMGVTVNKTLDPDSAEYKWEDQGIVLQSVPNRDLWNAIDSNVVIDDEGIPWMSFGSFWGGLKLVKLNDDLISIAEPQEWYSIAKRERSVLIDDTDSGPAALEGPFIFKKNGYYYLFLSWDKCCRGKDSTYKIMIGRSKNVTGPYLDKSGKDMAKGGGTLLLAGDENYYALGHNSAYTFDGKDYLVFHAYEVADNGRQKLKILEMNWDEDKWPVIDKSELNKYRSVLIK
ncbi:MAG: arabinan endo-1,5-alpha-L-arabinosidase [Gammaproteobacteria bacterium]|nr:arabinan endo-1,5-alpha-L-arabinosidase [Gammaproteobacteria bacterium]